MLTKENVLNKYEIESNGVVFVETFQVIKDDGVEISRKKHRAAYYPSETLPDTGWQEVNKVIADKWTNEIVAKYLEATKD